MYPIWEVPNLTAGIILAVIATFHILPSHLSTSAMWFNVYIETKAYKEDKPELLEFIRKYSLLLLVFAYVTGSLSGIGIWYAATVANPRGISGLIHNYVWGWATEWVFFIIEVTGIFIYYYTFGKVDRKTHLRIGWIFAIGSWTTMVVIVGILAFMLSPGKWIETGNFFDGFFNKTYWSQLLVRTTLMFAIAAVYAIAAAARLKNEEVRKFIIKTASKWGLAGLLLGGTAFFWYLKTIPAAGQELIQTFAPQGLKTGIIASFVLLLFYFIYANLKPLTIRLVTAVLAIAVLFAGIWSTERMREIIRKPYVISQYMYSNQIIGNDIASKNVTSETNLINQKGILAVSPFVPEPLRVVNDANMIEAGKLIARIECLSCHTLDKSGLRPMPQMVERRGFTDAEEMKVFLEGLDGYAYMPPFMGTEAEKNALANYLVSLNK
ncbi:MAG: cytochrome ubiquinol oxidase subunit I [Nitrospirae bacterium]|nr:cytochrome ubiquinol oxidase subunit I [Nitrospirota bacterium]